jgi:hypothetical protein
MIWPAIEGKYTTHTTVPRVPLLLRNLLQRKPLALSSIPLLELHMLIVLVLVLALVVQLVVQLLEHFPDVAREPVHRGVPVVVCVLLQCREDNRKQLVPVLCYQVDNVLIIPQEQGALRHLHTEKGISVLFKRCQINKKDTHSYPQVSR